MGKARAQNHCLPLAFKTPPRTLQLTLAAPPPRQDWACVDEGWREGWQLDCRHEQATDRCNGWKTSDVEDCSWWQNSPPVHWRGRQMPSVPSASPLPCLPEKFLQARLLLPLPASACSARSAYSPHHTRHACQALPATPCAVLTFWIL